MKMTPGEALSACTINAAYSLELGGQVGSLEPGKRADFALFDTSDWREIVYYFGAQRASSVYFGGKLVYGDS